MIADALPRWLLTVAFAAYALHCAYRCARDRVPGLVIGDVAHLLMALGMIAMAWPWGMGLPRAPQLAAFALGALWFCVQLVRRDPAHRDVCGRQGLALHAGMMAAMVWMVAAMPAAMAGDMPGNAMPGMPGMAGTGATPSDTPATLVGTAIAVGVLFLLLGTVWLARAIDMARVLPADGAARGVRLPVATVAADGVMSLGMGVMALLMA